MKIKKVSNIINILIYKVIYTYCYASMYNGFIVLHCKNTTVVAALTMRGSCILMGYISVGVFIFPR